MASKVICSLLLSLSAVMPLVANAYRYDDYSDGRSFFSDGQVWVYRRTGSGGGGKEVRMTARVIGDTVISSYMDYYGEVVRVDHPCKAISVMSDEGGVSESRYAAYEWDAEIYVYSDKAGDFVQLACFTRPENVKFLDCGEKWNTDRVDYVSPHGRLLKRYACSGVGTERSSVWIYRAGADRLWLSDTKWSGADCLEFESYHDPDDGVDYAPEDFRTSSFEPDNSFYADGKTWVYRSAYHERNGDPDVIVRMVVDGDEEYARMLCKRVSYSVEGQEPGHESIVCSAGGVMYEQGYMGLLMPRFDFNIVAGNKVVESDPLSEVSGVDFVDVCGMRRKRIVFKGEHADSEWKYWVEGIGGNAGNDALPRGDMDDMPDIYMPGSFVRCEENGRIVFEADDFSAGRSSVRELKEDAGYQDKDRYTIGGVKCPDVSAGSIVICSGKKYVSE